MAQRDMPQDDSENQFDPLNDARADQLRAQEHAHQVKDGTLDSQYGYRQTTAAYRTYDANAIAQERRRDTNVSFENRARERRRETPESETRRYEAELQSAELPERAVSSSARDNADAIPKLRTEQERQQQLVDALRQNAWLEKDKWQTLSPTERRVALEYAGRSLRDAYQCPDPPLIPEDFPEYDGKMLLGQYKDGDYDIEMNEKILDGKDAGEALTTYCHEFRHAYQHEMVQRYDSGTFRHLVHDKDAAAQWSRNLNRNGYQSPEVDFEKYRDQPVEEDARKFSEQIVQALYETKRT
ncbi:MAG TPA: hypothetical protein PLI09_15395 [Candidatus Hydrogenedentes bacterium]|nr:hypothetical protein [Candidatus Hydrogenedentota bacterium]